MSSIEYERSFNVSDITPYINYCEQNGYNLVSKVWQNRVVYECKHNIHIIARLTTQEVNGVTKTMFDYKNVDKSNADLKVSRESIPMEVTPENKDAILSILDTTDFIFQSDNVRTRYVYEKDDVIFEIDDYTKPQIMQVVAIEGNQEKVEQVYTKLKNLIK